MSYLKPRRMALRYLSIPLIDGMKSISNLKEVKELVIGLAIAISIFPTSFPLRISYKPFLNGQVS